MRPRSAPIVDLVAEIGSPDTGPRMAELIAEIVNGEYRPRPGSAGARLLELNLSEACRHHGVQDLARFAQRAYSRQGLWWVYTLDADGKQLTERDGIFLEAAFRQWVDGRNLFERGARHDRL